VLHCGVLGFGVGIVKRLVLNVVADMVNGQASRMDAINRTDRKLRRSAGTLWERCLTHDLYRSGTIVVPASWLSLNDPATHELRSTDAWMPPVGFSAGSVDSAWDANGW